MEPRELECPECGIPMTHVGDGYSQHWECNDDSHSPPCPDCGKSMIVRQATRGPNEGKHFWGCSQFPKCNAIRNFPDGDIAKSRRGTPQTMKRIARELAGRMDDSAMWRNNDDSLWVDETHLTHWAQCEWQYGRLAMDQLELDIHFGLPLELVEHVEHIIFQPSMCNHADDVKQAPLVKVLKSRTEICGVYDAASFEKRMPKHLLELRGRSQGRMAKAVDAARAVVPVQRMPEGAKLIFDTIARPEGSGVVSRRHCECCHRAVDFKKYDEVSEDEGIPKQSEWRTWHVICDTCLEKCATDNPGRYKTRLRFMPAEYREFVYASMPQIRRQGLRQLDSRQIVPKCFGDIKSTFVDEHKTQECMLCCDEHRCHQKAVLEFDSKQHPDECYCERCVAHRKPIPPKSMSFPIVKHTLPGFASDQIVAAQPMTARNENIFMERNADGTQTMCFKPSTPYDWRYVLRPVVKLERRRSSGWDPESSGATRRDGWDS